MGIYIETLILYIVLFFSGAAGSFLNNSSTPEGFSAGMVLTRTFLHNIPSLALIWYLLLKAKPVKDWEIKPAKKDLISGLITFPCLLITGFLVAHASSGIGGAAAVVSIYSPSSPSGWVILCIFCVSAAYLEESFFRFYLLSRMDELRLNAPAALAVSTALFSICHIYEGPWGFLNAVLSGTILAFIFLRYRSLHGIAIAHSLYNISVYVINALFA